MMLYHGSNENFSELNNKVVFFSESEDFADRYGKVKVFRLSATRIFNTCNEQDVKKLLERVNSLYDAYDDVEYKSWEKYKQCSNFGSDSWEIFEPHFNTIKNLGYDTVIIYEGGYQNYATLNGNFEAV